MTPDFPAETWFAAACDHEAAHAVMAYIFGWPSPRIIASEENEDFAAYYKVRQLVHPHAQLCVVLAGFACETWFEIGRRALAEDRSDFRHAREILKQRPILRYEKIGERFVFHRAETALRMWFERSNSLLRPHAEEVKALGRLLETAGELSSRRVAAFMRRRIAPRLEYPRPRP